MSDQFSRAARAAASHVSPVSGDHGGRSQLCARPAVVARQLQFQFANGHQLWPALNFTLHHQASGLVGRNGIGKSVLAQLLARRLEPFAGSVTHHGRTGYLAQNQDSRQPLAQSPTLAGLLGFEAQLAAWQRVEAGSTAQQDFDLLEQHWDLPQRLELLRDQLGDSSLQWETQLGRLSGGQQMRLRLLALLSQRPDFLILDEPSNHLDQGARRWLAQQLAALSAPDGDDKPCGLLVISHDRELLEPLHSTLELTSLGIRRYGGGFSAYFEQKQGELEASERRLSLAKQEVQHQRRQQQARLEKQQQSVARGKAKVDAGGVTRFAKENMQRRGEKTSRRNLGLAQDRQQKAASQLADIKASLEWVKPIGLSLESTKLSPAKRVVALEQLTCGFLPGQPLLQIDQLLLQGPARVWLRGDNGSGKSCLLKTLAGQIPALSGRFTLGTRFAYLDQQLAFLRPEQSAAENFQRLAPGFSPAEYRTRLAWLRLRREKADLPLSELSGGEQLKVALACSLLGPDPVQLLLLDEPDNHLDLESLTALESALEAYRGALILVSHDSNLAANIGTDTHWQLAGGRLRCQVL